MRIKGTPVDPSKPQSIADQLGEVVEVLNRQVEFGEPLDPNDPQSVVLAGGLGAGAHNGTPGNIWASWVEIEVGGQGAELDTPIACHHNLYLEDPDYVVPVAGEPNVRWFVVGWQHSGDTKTLWEDLRVPMNSARIGTARPPTFAAGPVAPFDTLPIWWFAYQAVAGNEEQMYFATQMPHNWKEETQLYPHIHWTPELAAPAPNDCVKWGLEYSWANMGATFPATTTIYTDATDDTTQTEQAEQLVQARHYLSRFEVDGTGLHGAPAAIDSTGQTISSMLVCRLFRNSSHADDDHNTSDAGLLEVDFHYEVDGFGSDMEHAKTADVELEWGTHDIRFQAGDTVNENDIELRAYASPGLKVDSSDKLKLTLLFIRATR